MWKILADIHICTYVKHRLQCAYFQEFREFSAKLSADLVYWVSTKCVLKSVNSTEGVLFIYTLKYRITVTEPISKTLLHNIL